MWSAILSLTLLLTAAGLISGAALPPRPRPQNPRIPGLPLQCRRIPSEPGVQRLQNIRNPTRPVAGPRSLSPRVIPYCIEGVLTGGQHSQDFVLRSGQTWTLYWTVDRLVPFGTVNLWHFDARSPGEAWLLDSAPMETGELDPFMPAAGLEHYIEFVAVPEGRISWYMATQ